MFRLILLIAGVLFSTSIFGSIIIGNPKGSVTLIEVFDYQCPFCHREYPIIKDLIKKNSDLKVKLMPTATVNNLSIEQAAAAIVATQYGNKFQQFTEITLSNPPMDQQQVTATLKRLGLTDHYFVQTMHSKAVEKQMLEGRKLMRAEKTGSPLIIIYPTQHPKPKYGETFKGYRTEKRLQRAINHARKYQ